ncbi:MAG TPA: hypothetical protein VEH81_07475 [Ktedonobacteraceae bacterium]|nr:hypothetical protein [Ktedonobacteraceae bacterium]
MDKLVIGVTIAISFLIVSLIVFIENRRNAQDHTEWLKYHGMIVKASVAQVQTRQDWKYEQEWYRDSWDGMLKRKRTWQMYYEVTAHWMDLRTKQLYTFHGKVWSDAVTGRLEEGNPIRVIVDPDNPKRYSMDFQSIPELT